MNESAVPPTAPVVKKRPKVKRAYLAENMWGWAFLSLNLTGYIIFKLVPILITLVLSFCDWDFTSGLAGIRFTGLRNYINLWSDDVFLRSLLNTLYFALVNVPLSMALSLIVAVVLNDKVFCKSFIRLNFYLPNISSMVAVSVIWGILYLPGMGPINSFLQSLGVENPPGWISSSVWAMPALIIMSVWSVIGYNLIIILAGLQGIPRTYYESAEIDGATTVSKFFKITLPMLSPTLFFLLIMSIIRSFQVFTQVNIMTKGGPGNATTVLVYYIFRTAFGYYKIGYANSVAWILFVLVFIVTAIQWRLQKKWVHV